MNFNLKAHVDHQIQIQETHHKMWAVASIDISPDPYNPTAPAVISCGEPLPDKAMQSQLYCRTCDIYLTSPWLYT